MRITKSQLRQIIKEEADKVMKEQESRYEAGSAGDHIEQARRMAKELDELEAAMPKPIRNKYATGLGFMIEKELDKALDVMDNTEDYYKMQLRDLNEGFEDLGQEIGGTVRDIEKGKSKDDPKLVATRFIEAMLEELREKLSPILEPGDFDKALAEIINDDDEPEEADPDTATGEFIIGKG